MLFVFLIMEIYREGRLGEGRQGEGRLGEGRQGEGRLGERSKVELLNFESTQQNLKKRIPQRHRGHRGTQSVGNQHYKPCELSEAVSRTP
jgi:hypothetical protein